MLFFTLDMAFLMLGIGYLQHDAKGTPQGSCIKAGGAFGIIAAFLAWYNALAGILDDSNRYAMIISTLVLETVLTRVCSFFVIPVAHFPWSVTGREKRMKSAREQV